MTAAMFDFTRAFRRSSGLAIVLLLLLTGTGHAQIPGISTKTAEAVPIVSETPEDTSTRIQQWLTEARASFARVNEPDAEKALPEGIDAAALADYRRDLEQTITGIGRYQNTLDGMPEVHRALEEARAAESAWHGFSETPPFSILMLDELLSQQDSIQEKSASYRSSLALFTRTLAGIQDEARDSEDTSRKVLSAAAEESAKGGTANWRLEADRAKSRLLSIRATFLTATITVLKAQTETTKFQLSLLGRQIGIAKQKAHFSDEDLATVKKAAADRQAALRKELAAVRNREQEASAIKSRMQLIKDKLLKETPEGTPLETTPDLALATVKMEASETRVNSLQYVASTLETLDELESDAVESYINRKTLLDSKSKDARAAALQTLRSAYDRSKARGIVAGNELAAVNADIGRQEARASARPADDPRLIPLNDVRASLWDKQAVIQRAVQAAAAQSRMLNRWLDDYDQTRSSRSVRQRFSETATSLWTKFKSIWSIDVFTYQDTVMIGGVASTQERGVTLGQFFIAISAFLLAYFIASRIKNRLRNTVVRHGHIAEAQAKTLSNWMMIVVGLLLAAGTLHFLKIPITVFAFLGGALVIGLGFGTQTLIKNFISGIIVLFERKIRVGDVVDIGGIAGSIIEINTRSSVLRGPDGRESLVPNSVFLENTVTNLTLSNRSLRRSINVGVAYGSSTQMVTTILIECAERHGLIQKDPPPLVIFQDFGDNALVFKLYMWVVLDGKTNPELVESDLRMMIEKRFSEAGISFPFPQRDLHLRTASPIQVSLTPPAPET